ncbi:glycosyltransferase [Hyphomicrobium sp.]|uniref:glycosyltransferase n=1 Tax=Hyphomicrobium sp. TaxID=82 RepID=UPI002D76C3FF|nr:glycosyltransferase [Hyphomicrobium sp.]HET6391048.1 glycosyltransferase [Hyphomicrobium sp.]
MVDFSAAVCTYNRALHLDKCLESFSRQTASSPNFEVIIVDNASTDGTREVAERWADRDPRFIYTYEPVEGLARARNHALEMAASPFIAFTDDDAVVPDNWVQSYFQTFSKLPDDVFAIGGEIDPIFEADRPHWLTDELLKPLSARLGWSDEARMLVSDEWLCEVNIAFRVELLRQHGGFPEELGRKGDNLLSGENFVNVIARSNGFKEYFDPAIRVQHFIPASRLTKTWFRRRYFWQGVTQSKYPNIARQKYDQNYPYWQQIGVPTSTRDWLNLLSDSTSDEEFAGNCFRISDLGYIIGLNELISGR